MPEQAREREILKSLIINNALKFSEGKTQDSKTQKWTFDLREIMLREDGIKHIAALMYERLKDLKFDAIGGPSIAAEPLTSALLLHFLKKGREVRGFVVRKEPKQGRIKKMIEGPIKKGDDVVLIDDALNKGMSKKKAIDEIEASGLKIKKILVIVDLMREGNQQFRNEGYDVESLFEANEFGIYVNRSYRYTPIQLNRKRTEEGLGLSDSDEEWELFSESGTLHFRKKDASKTEWAITLGEKISHFLVDGDLAVVAAFSGLGRSILHAISMKERTSILKIPIKGEIKSRPVSCNECYLVCSNDGTIICIGKNSKEVKWKSKPDSGIEKSPIIFEGSDRIFITAVDGNLYCLDKEGNRKWKKHLAHRGINKVVKGNERIYAVSDRGILFCLEEESGKIIWLHELKDSLIDIVYKEGSVLLLCEQGVFLSLDEKSGEIVRCSRVKNKKFKKFLGSKEGFIAQCEDGDEYDASKA